MDETNIKPWTEHHEYKYNWLYNYMNNNYPDVEYDNYIDTYQDKFIDIIHNNPNWGNQSKEALFFLVARWLEINQQNNPYIKIYQNEGWKLKMIIEQKEVLNELDQKELKYYRSREYFINILDNIDIDTIDNIIDHYKYLLLSLLVKQPPLRPSFYISAKIINREYKNNNIDNYLLLNRTGQLKAYYIINKDKVSNYNLYKFSPNLKKIDIVDNDIVQLINKSLIKYPRSYLFEINKKPISYETLLKWLRDITKVSLINFDIMRASYITWFYKNKHNYSDKDKLSKQMRHSVRTAMVNYNKIDDNINDINDDESRNRLIKKRKNDIIYNIRQGRIPKKSTLKKYNIDIKNYIN